MKNRLLAITGSALAMEADVDNGKLHHEQEKVIYARLEDLSVLHNAETVDAQEQWMIKLKKSDKNAAKGQIRVRKVIPMTKGDNGFEIKNADSDRVQYVLTAKAERSAEDRLEVPSPVTKDMFDVFKLVADNGMLKHRFHFPVDGGLVFEVDAFPKEDGTYHEWVKIDLELKDINTEIPELPFEAAEKIFGDSKDEAEQKKIWELYETIFLSANVAVESPRWFNRSSVAQEGLKDWILDKFTGKFDMNDVASVRSTIELISKAGAIEDRVRTFKAGTDTNILRFLLKDEEFVDNLPAEIKRDAEQLKRFVAAIGELNSALRKIKGDDEVSEVIASLKSVREATLVRLDRTMWLGGMQVRFHKEKAGARTDRSWDGEITQPRVDTEEGAALDSFVVDVLTYMAAREQYKENIVNLNKVMGGIDLVEFKRASSALERELSNLMEGMIEFVKHADRLKSHQVGEVRKSLRFGHRLTTAGYHVALAYKPFYRYVV